MVFACSLGSMRPCYSLRASSSISAWRCLPLPSHTFGGPFLSVSTTTGMSYVREAGPLETRLAVVPVGGLLVRVCGTEEGGLSEVRAEELEANG